MTEHEKLLRYVLGLVDAAGGVKFTPGSFPHVANPINLTHLATIYVEICKTLGEKPQINQAEVL